MKRIALGLLFCWSIVGISCGNFLENDLEKINKQNEQDMLNYINSKNLQMVKTESGIYYNITKTNASGAKVQLGDEVKIHFLMSLLDGTRIDSSSRLKNEPVSAVFGGTLGLQGLLEAISVLKEGERGTFLIPSVLAYGSSSLGAIPANSVVVLDLEAVQFRTEEKQIDDYIKALGTTVKILSDSKTSTGLRILKVTETTGAQLKTGQIATVKYTGYLASTVKQFDTGQIDVGLGNNAVVKGFEEGLLQLKVGEKAFLVFPSAIGYSNTGVKDTQTGAYRIPPYSPLIFMVEVKSAI